MTTIDNVFHRRQWMPWFVVAAMFTVATFSWGLTFYGLGFYLRELNELHGWSLTALSLVTFVFHLAATALSFPVSTAIARRGPRPVFITGAVTTTVTVAAIGVVEHLWQLTVIYLVMAIGWSCLSLNPISATVLAWHHSDRSGPPLTIALTGASAGGVLIIPLLARLNGRYGLRTTLVVAALAQLAVVGSLALTIVRFPTTASRAEATGGSAAWHLLGRTRFWVLSAGLGLAIAAQVGFLVHQLSFLTTSLDPTTAAEIVALTTASGFAGRLIFIALTRRTSPLTAGLGFLTAQSAALATLSRDASTASTVGLASAVFGLGIGVIVTLPPLLTRTHFPREPFTSSFPLVNAAFSLAVALGAPLTALLHDTLDGYPATFLALAIADLAAVALLAIAASHRPRPGEGGGAPAHPGHPTSPNPRATSSASTERPDPPPTDPHPPWARRRSAASIDNGR